MICLCTPISSGLFTPLSAVPSLDFIASYTTRTTPGKAADISTAAESIQRPSLRQNQKNQSLPSLALRAAGERVQQPSSAVQPCRPVAPSPYPWAPGVPLTPVPDPAPFAPGPIGILTSMSTSLRTEERTRTRTRNW